MNLSWLSWPTLKLVVNVNSFNGSTKLEKLIIKFAPIDILKNKKSSWNYLF